ncbi:hypothetical protein [Vogesella indigofera]|uniref:hypothetical protein n=1 Tax=Vogesella indigofera TaxID=45465 RepID=UPI00234FAF1B|nr:hypothetical protein [Vogesella indigofera]MDC7700593.1 hypothetical protein [Vogesella indigofera]
MLIHGLPPAAHGLPCFAHGAVFVPFSFFLLFLLKNKEIEKDSEEKEKQAIHRIGHSMPSASTVSCRQSVETVESLMDSKH